MKEKTITEEQQIQVVKDILESYKDKQVNLSSEAARTEIAEQIIIALELDSEKLCLLFNQKK
tara:strand:- start:143 stop:328 length:186 start_codon:yes stop_codon:yes gene_type:complete